MYVSIEHTVVTLNGHVVRGWSEDGQALEMPTEFVLASVRRGPQGGMVGADSGMKGGPVTIKLLPNAESLSFFERQVAAILGDEETPGAVIRWQGRVEDLVNGKHWELVNGLMVNGSLGVSLGAGTNSDQMFRFEFQRIIPHVDGANYGNFDAMGRAVGLSS